MDVSRLTYKPGWSFKIGGPGNGFLCVYATTPDSGKPERTRCTQHMFRLPPSDLTPADFARWVFACLLLCEQHEAAEFLKVNGVAPFFPHHQDEGDPYELVDRTEEFDGSQSPRPWPDGCPVRVASDLLRRQIRGEGESARSAG